MRCRTLRGHGRARHSPLLPGLGLQHTAGTAAGAGSGRGGAASPRRWEGRRGPGCGDSWDEPRARLPFGLLGDPAALPDDSLPVPPARSQDATATGRPGPRPSRKRRPPPTPHPVVGSCGNVAGKCPEDPGDPAVSRAVIATE